MRKAWSFPLHVALTLLTSQASTIDSKAHVSLDAGSNVHFLGMGRSLLDPEHSQRSKEESLKCHIKHSDLLGTIKEELAHLERRGINASSLDELYWPRYLRSKGDHPDRPFFQIHRGKVYAHRDSFLSGPGIREEPYASADFVNQLCTLLRRWPDLPSLRLMVNDHDHTEQYDGVPLFAPWKVKGSIPVLYPHRTAEEFEHEPAWKDKIPKAFFAGSASDDGSVFALTRSKRRQLQKLHDHDEGLRELLDIHVDENKQHHYNKKEQTKWKYQLVMDGTAARRSYIEYLSMHSLVLKPQSVYYQFFEPALVAYEHLVPVNLTDLEADLKAKVQWALEHDDIAKGIADKSSAFARHHLQTDGVQCYFRELLLQYHDLMHFDDALPDEFASSPDLCSEIAPGELA